MQPSSPMHLEPQKGGKREDDDDHVFSEVPETLGLVKELSIMALPWVGPSPGFINRYALEDGQETPDHGIQCEQDQEKLDASAEEDAWRYAKVEKEQRGLD